MTTRSALSVHRTWATTVLVCLFAAQLAVGQTTTRASVASDGTQGNATSVHSCISANGRFVVFDSSSSNLVPGDTNARSDIFVHDRTTQTTTRVSVDSAGAQGNGNSWFPVISADGTVVVFESDATNLVAGDFNGQRDVFVHDRQTGFTTRVSVDSFGVQGFGGSGGSAMSWDGRIIAFDSTSRSLVAGDTNNTGDVFVHDRQTGVTTRVSVDSTGVEANGGSWQPSISADGMVVAFSSLSSNLVSGDTNNRTDTFVHDRQTGATTRVSVDSAGGQGDGNSARPSICGNGLQLAFDSVATNLVAGDTNRQSDVFVHDRQTGATTRISVDSTGVQGDLPSQQASFSADSSTVAFSSSARNLVPGDTNASGDVFVHTLATGATARVSVDSAGVQGNSHSLEASVSGDGRVVSYSSLATNLVSGDTNSVHDVFASDRVLLTFNGIAQSPSPISFTVSNALGETGNTALVLLSCTGTAGFPLPGAGIVPLTLDPCTSLSLSASSWFSASLSSAGTGTTTPFRWPRVDPGITLYAAAVTIDFATPAFVSITGPTSFTTQ